VLTAINKDDMMGAELAANNYVNDKKITFKEVNPTLCRNLKLNLNLLFFLAEVEFSSIHEIVS
jgi:hypothetical protein